MTWQIKHGDWINVLQNMPDESVYCCVTSPPYWGLRDYGVPGQLGLERTPDEYVAKMVEGFREVRRVLRKDGTCWINLGDSYASGDRATYRSGASSNKGQHVQNDMPKPKTPSGTKAKDLIGVPWMVAFALRSDGWYLRQDIIWSKPNPMPESVTDRCTKSHEYLFLLSKSERYYFDQDAILEPCSASTHARLSQDVQNQIGSERVPGKTNGNMKACAPASWRGSSFTDERDLTVRPNTGRNRKLAEPGSGTKNNSSFDAAMAIMPEKRNKRSVWEVTTQPFSEAHFATFPPKLVEPCILAGCPEGGTVLDPFAGAGTTGLVATRLHRNFIGIELNQDYIAMATRRIREDAPLFNTSTLSTSNGDDGVGPQNQVLSEHASPK